MDKKYKVLTLSDHPLAPSGVGIQTRILLEGLINTGKYSFISLAGAIKHQDYNTITVNPDFIIKPVDGFGTREMLRNILATEKPDSILMVTDPRQFIWLWEMEDEIHQVCPMAYWCIWDEAPYPEFNSVLYDSTDLLNNISHLSYELTKPHFPEKTNYIPHAFPKSMFYPLPQEKIDDVRKHFFGDRKDWFTALWVNRNAARKMPSDVLESFKEFLDMLEKREGHRKALLLMHTDPSDVEGPNLFSVSQMLGIQNNVIYSNQRVDFETMNNIHNACDVVITMSKAEGFGLSVLQNLQVGKPVIVGTTGGLTRQVIDWRDGTEHGVALKPVKKCLVGSQLVPYIYEYYFSQTDAAEALYKVFKYTPEEKKALSKKAIDYVDFQYNHENMIKEWDRTLTDCIEKFKNSYSRWACDEIVGSQQPQQQFQPANNVSMQQPSLAPPVNLNKKKVNIEELIKQKKQSLQK